MQIEITKKQGVVVALVVGIIFLGLGGYYGYSKYQEKRIELNKMRSELSETKASLSEKETKIAELAGNLNLTEEEKKKAEEAKTKAEGEASKANTKLATTTTQLNSTKSELATANYIAENLLGVSGTLAEQKTYYESANTAILNCLNYISEGYWTTAEYYCKQADSYLAQARSLNGTVNYYLGKLGY